jgi:hypothetical protein
MDRTYNSCFTTQLIKIVAYHYISKEKAQEIKLVHQHVSNIYSEHTSISCKSVLHRERPPPPIEGEKENSSRLKKKEVNFI